MAKRIDHAKVMGLSALTAFGMKPSLDKKVIKKSSTVKLKKRGLRKRRKKRSGVSST